LKIASIEFHAEFIVGHNPRFSFQQVFLQTQLVQRGHWMKSGLISTTAFRKASS
jgi:hypothetical protein